ncbi:MAG: phosphatidate cytidylyltransferase [Planctomycetota bacterium]
MLGQRLIVGALLIACLLGGVWADDAIDAVEAPQAVAEILRAETWPPGLIVLPLVSLLAVLAARELSGLLRDKSIDASPILTAGMALVGVLLTGIVPDRGTAFDGAATINTTTALVLVGSMIFYSLGKKTEGAVAAAGGALLGFAYIGLLLGFLVAIRREHSAWTLLWVIGCAKSCDIGAYFVGKSFGKRKLILWLSPGKTWEGLAGGVALAAIMGGLGGWALEANGIEPFGPLVGAASGAALGLVGQAGDLSASLLKRDAGAKDSGHSVPGFGGVIDVVDSLLLVGPVGFWLLRAITG